MWVTLVTTGLDDSKVAMVTRSCYATREQSADGVSPYDLIVGRAVTMEAKGGADPSGLDMIETQPSSQCPGIIKDSSPSDGLHGDSSLELRPNKEPEVSESEVIVAVKPRRQIIFI
ncbi:hypothetical protein ABVT39_015561 [Epinephelus coioides]